MPNGVITIGPTSSSTAFFSGITVGPASVSFTANFINNSSTNVHTYDISTSWGFQTGGTIARNSSVSVPVSSPFLGYQTDGVVTLIKFGPNGGILGSASFNFTTGTPDAPPPPPTPAPAFTDTTVAAGMLGRSYSDGVAANTTTSYAIAAGGSLPPGLSLNTTTGAITGIPTQQGSFTFVINASGGGGTTGSGNLTIQISPAGNRRNSSGFDSNLAVARRYNGTSWVNLTTMRRFNGTSWVNIIN